MDLTSQQDIPVPINATFAPGLHDRHGHVIHHHLHQDHHRLQNPYLDKHEHDPPSPHNNHNDIPQSSVPAAARPTAATQQPPPQQIPSSIIIPSPEILHDQGDDRDDQTPRNSNGNSRKHRHDPHHEEVIIRYRECLKNHAASMGGNSTDGCGEFMPSGQEGTLEALTCSACNCHRNFHRKEVLQAAGTQPSPGAIIMPTPSSRVATSSCFDYHHHPDPRPHPHQMMMVVNNSRAIGGGRKLINMVYPATANANINAKPCRSVPPLMPTYCSSMDGAGGSEDLSDDQHGGGSGLMIGRYRVGGDPPPPPLTGAGMSKKRFRTKFSQEQKERMLNFAESVGWKIQKQEESVVQQFCQEIGVKRRVLKVWMHNNKHNLAKKTVSSAATPPTAA